jgi:hypothetical protein
MFLGGGAQCLSPMTLHLTRCHPRESGDLCFAGSVTEVAGMTLWVSTGMTLWGSKWVLRVGKPSYELSGLGRGGYMGATSKGAAHAR